MNPTTPDDQIDQDEALTLLRSTPVGRVAFMVDDEPWGATGEHRHRR